MKEPKLSERDAPIEVEEPSPCQQGSLDTEFLAAEQGIAVLSLLLLAGRVPEAGATDQGPADIANSTLLQARLPAPDVAQPADETAGVAT